MLYDIVVSSTGGLSDARPLTRPTVGRLENKKTPTMRQSHGGATLAGVPLPIRSNAHPYFIDGTDPESRQENGKRR
jgi:hypothetical protein